ncbi:MAG: hypothetical protein FWF80_09045 [Defluviitaleaceae bacterium]|nr:hypothetical protein [Defluviitaleaceae bacterium]
MTMKATIGSIILGAHGGNSDITDFAWSNSTTEDAEQKGASVKDVMTICGKIRVPKDDDHKSLELAQWSQVPPSSEDAYKEVSVECVDKNTVVRFVKFPNAFVVSYDEKFNVKGECIFELEVRQRGENLSEIEIEGNYPV